MRSRVAQNGNHRRIGILHLLGTYDVLFCYGLSTLRKGFLPSNFYMASIFVIMTSLTLNNLSFIANISKIRYYHSYLFTSYAVLLFIIDYKNFERTTLPIDLQARKRGHSIKPMQFLETTRCPAFSSLYCIIFLPLLQYILSNYVSNNRILLGQVFKNLA